MITSHKCCVIILVVAVAALALRLPRLSERPMHCDEAVHAYKFGPLLETGYYRYESGEHHGPILNYMTVISAWLGSVKTYVDTTEFTLRIVPLFFGVLLVLLLLLVRDALSPSVATIAAILTAVSPAMVFYSRYYIQEMLLVCFTFGLIASAWRYSRTKNIRWSILIGLFAALMFCTKETCIIAFGSMTMALVLMFITTPKEVSVSSALKTIKPLHVIVALAGAVVVWAMFYSSFFTNPAGLSDSLLNFKSYLGTAAGNRLHVHPWYFYLERLIYWRPANSPLWTEAFIIVLAVVGFIVAVSKNRTQQPGSYLLRFIAFYTLIMTVVYSAIPYKTPWCMLSFLHGMILLAAVGAVAIVKSAPNLPTRVFIVLLLIAGTSNLTRQSYLAGYRYSSAPSNPYVYAHTGKDVFTITDRLEAIARVHPQGRAMHIEIICPATDYWPLPWYLRSFINVGYRSEVPADIADAPVIIADPIFEKAIVHNLYELPAPGTINLYVPLFDSYTEIRPQIELRGYIRSNLWNDYRQSMRCIDE